GQCEHKHIHPSGGTGEAQANPVLPDNVTTRRSWRGGPLRLSSRLKTNFTPLGYFQGGFVGSYVCGRCRSSCDGVYRVREEQEWLCGGCRRAFKAATPGAVKHQSPLQTLGQVRR